MADDVRTLLASLSLTEYAPKFGGTTLAALKAMGKEDVKAFLKDLDIPVPHRSQIQKGLFEQETTVTRSMTSSPGKDLVSAELPAGWRALFDEKSAKTYYWNTVTNEVSWKRPKEAALSPTFDGFVTQKYPAGKINLSSFDLLTTLGTGSFGRVRLARDLQTGKYLALKILNKSEIVRMKQVHHIKNEKAVLEQLDHPFVVNLLGCFQDPCNLYLALEYVPGGELFSLLRRRKRFNNDVSVFFAAQIVQVFEHMHARKIAYRDLKPENLLIDRDGYLKVTDFGFAKEIPLDQRSFTICGTPEYLAPEIIQGRGHSTACDWWALGILIFEMLVGNPPFESETPYGIYKKVLAGDLSFPRLINDEAKNLLVQLLNPKPAYRLGNLKNGVDDVKSHPWFKDVDWNVLERKKLRAPYLPKIRDEADTSNFARFPEQPATTGIIVPIDVFPEFGSI